jgi:hypothetical protein
MQITKTALSGTQDKCHCGKPATIQLSVKRFTTYGSGSFKVCDNEKCHEDKVQGLIKTELSILNGIV